MIEEDWPGLLKKPNPLVPDCVSIDGSSRAFLQPVALIGRSGTAIELVDAGDELSRAEPGRNRANRGLAVGEGCQSLTPSKHQGVPIERFEWFR